MYRRFHEKVYTFLVKHIYLFSETIRASEKHIQSFHQKRIYHQLKRYIDYTEKLLPFHLVFPDILSIFASEARRQEDRIPATTSESQSISNINNHCLWITHLTNGK